MQTATATSPATQTNGAHLTGAPACPKCGGRMWDNRATKRNPKAPDFKCRDRACDGVFWPGQHKAAVAILTPRAHLNAAPSTPAEAPDGDDEAGQGSARQSGGDRPMPWRQALRACYLDATDFVLSQVRPKYEDAGVPCNDATVAAIVATLFIATCRAEGA